MAGRRTSPGALALAGVGLTQTAVAAAAGVSQSAVSAVLRGDRERAGSRAREAVIAAVAALGGLHDAVLVEAAVLRAERES